MSFETKDRLMQATIAIVLVLSIIVLCLAFAGRIWAATLCVESQGDKAQHWMWREIDGRRCYYQGERLLPKSELRWGDDAPVPNEHKLMHWERKNQLKLERANRNHPDQSRPSGRTLPVEGDGLQGSHTPMQSVPHVLDVPTRIMPEGMGNMSNNGQAKPIDLMRGEELQGAQMLGGVLVIPPY